MANNYAATTDLPDSKFGNVMIDSSESGLKQRLLDDAAGEIDHILEPIYTVPIASLDLDDRATLKRACVGLGIAIYLEEKVTAYPDFIPVAREKRKSALFHLEPYVKGYRQFKGATLRSTLTENTPVAVKSPDKYNGASGSLFNNIYENYE